MPGTVSGDYEETARNMTKDFLQKSKEQVKALLQTMKDASRTLWRCDPRDHEEHVTFEQLTRLLQVKL